MHQALPHRATPTQTHKKTLTRLCVLAPYCLTLKLNGPNLAATEFLYPVQYMPMLGHAHTQL